MAVDDRPTDPKAADKAAVDDDDTPDQPSKFEQLREKYPWLDHMVRAGARYTDRHGDHYAAAITYFSVLALVPLLMIAFAIAGFALRAQPELLDQLRVGITTAVPGALGDTLLTWLIALALGSAAGIVIGLVTSAIPFLRRPSMVVVNVARAVPATALLPIAILMFGLATEMKVAIAFWAILWPIIINTSYGVLGTEPLRLDAARSMRWPWWRRQVYVTLPSALPSILTGVRVATGTALVVVIAAELLGARSGVGTFLRLYQQALRPDIVYAAVIVVGLLGALLYTVLVRLERRAVGWRASA